MKFRKLLLTLFIFIFAFPLMLTPAQAQTSKSLNIAFVQDIDTMNYGMYSNQYFSSILMTLWNSPPWVFDQNLKATPRLVTEVPTTENGDVSADGKTITLHLRKDIKWSDNEPITSADFVFTYKMYMDNANAVVSRSPYDQMASVTAPDPQTVVVTFNDVYAPWLTSIFLSVMPQHILQPVFDKDGTLDNADFNRLPSVSSGPFIAADRQTGNYILFKRNDNYFDAPAKLDQIYIRIVPDDAAQVAALLNDDVDLGIFIAPDDAKTLQEKGVNIVTVNSGYNEGIFFNFKPNSGHDAIQDLAVRQAIAYGLNRDGIAADLLKYGSGPDDHNVIADTYWHDTPWANPAIHHEQFDADKAKQLLQDDGWIPGSDGIRVKNGQRLHLTWATNDRTLRTQVQAVGQQQLKDIGIETELVNLPSDTFFGSYGDGNPVAQGKYDFWEYSDTTSFPDPNTDYWKCSEIPTDANPSGVNNQYLCDKQLDALFSDESHSADPDVRKQDFFKIQQLIADNLYWMPLWHDPDLWALNAKLQNINLAPTTQFWNSANWDISS